MADPAIDKSALRKRMKALRDAIPVVQRTQASETIARQVLALPEIQAADRIFCYVSFVTEVDTHRLIEALLHRGKTVAVPRLRGPTGMVAHPIASLDDLVSGRYGFLQPRPEAAMSDLDAQVTLIPGLAFTRRGDRLGYGAGHYDRYLAAHPHTTPIGLCFHAQIVTTLPTGPHDIPMQRLVTEEQHDAV